MKKILIAALAGTLLLTSLTACGSKKDAERDYDSSRVLYTDTDTQTDEEETDTESETESDKKESSKSESKKAESKKSESKKAESKKSESSKAASSKSASSKKVTVYTPSSKAASSAVSSASASSAVSSKDASSENSSSEKTSSDETDTEKLTDTDSAAQTDTDTSADTETDSASNAEPVTKGGDLRYNTGAGYVDLGDDMEAALEILGEPDSVTAAGACLGGAEIKLYSFGAFEITAYPADNSSEKYQVATIKLIDEGEETERGVHIGMPIEEALKAYGDGYESLGAATYKYKTDDGSYIMISAEDDTVSEIIISLDTTVL